VYYYFEREEVMETTTVVVKESTVVCVGNEKESILRPAWTSSDLHAYRHKHINGTIYTDFYHRRMGL